MDRLLEAGASVVVIDDFNDYYDPAIKRANVRPHLERSERYQLVEGDIRDRALVQRLIRESETEIVIHLAARAGVRPSVEDPYLYQTTNVEGTLNLLDGARRHGVKRFVFVSSSSVYGVNDKVPFAEDDPILAAASPYAATKIAGEALCSSFSHLYDMPSVSLRFFTVFGPRQRPDLAIRKFTELLRAGEPIQLYGDGTSSRDYTYVADIVRGILAAVELDSRGHEIFNLGNGSPTTLIELVRTIEDVLGVKAEIEWLPTQPGDVPRTYADVRKASARLGYTPQTSLREGIAQMVRWLDSQAAS